MDELGYRPQYYKQRRQAGNGKNQETLIPEGSMSELHRTPGSQRQLHRVGPAGPAHRTARLQPTGVAPGFQPRVQGRQEKGLGAKDTRAKAEASAGRGLRPAAISGASLQVQPAGCSEGRGGPRAQGGAGGSRHQGCPQGTAVGEGRRRQPPDQRGA